MEKILNLLDICRAGTEAPLRELGRGGTPLAFAKVGGESPLVLTAPVFLNRAEFGGVFAAATRRRDDLICAVRDCFLLGPFGAVVLPTGELLRQSLINLDGDALQYSLAQFIGQYPGAYIPWTAAESPVFAVNSYATNNYFHFLIDSLADLHWRARVPGASDMRAIVSGYGPTAEATLPFIPSAYAGAGLTRAQLQPFDGTLLFCRFLMFPRRATGATPARVAWLRNAFSIPATRGTDRLYIARGDAQRRRIVNEREVIQRLERRGFRAVTPGALPVRDQAALFARAGLVVGPHGAGLANCAFMAPGGAVVELTHTGRVVGTYHELAGAAGLSYGAVVGEMIGDAGQPILADFKIDLDALDAAVDAATKGMMSAV